MKGPNVFPGGVTRAGKFVPDDRNALKRRVGAYAGKRIEIVVRAETTQRSLDQNAYLHCTNGPFHLLAEYFGYTIPEVKYVLMGECFGWHMGPTGREIPMKPSTSEMTVEECTYFIDWLIPWAATEHGVLIPLPNEVMAA